MRKGEKIYLHWCVLLCVLLFLSRCCIIWCSCCCATALCIASMQALLYQTCTTCMSPITNLPAAAAASAGRAPLAPASCVTALGSLLRMPCTGCSVRMTPGAAQVNLSF